MMKNPIRPALSKLLLLLVLVCQFAGCSKEETSESTSPAKPRVALIMKSLANEFFINMSNGAKAHQAQNREAYELLVNGIKNESDLSQQVSLVEQMMASAVDAIVIAPADSKALVPVLKRAKAAGIVVINIDNKLDEQVLKDSGISIPFVGPDNREGARMVGAYLASSLSPKDQVAIIGGIETAFNAQQRQKGFTEAMENAGVEVVSVQSGEWEQARASVVAAALITEYPQLKALLCSNDNMAIGAAAAIRQAGKSGEILVVGFDNIQATHQLIRDDAILATADQYGNKLAVFGIEYALKLLEGAKTPGDRKTPVDLITKQELANLK